MASLDDFFKKRDKKKKTTKSKLDIDEFAKKLEASTITGGDVEEGGDVLDTINSSENATLTNNSNAFASASVGSVSAISGGGGGGNTLTNGGGEQVDEEWKPFDSDENKDYTGLRININNWKVDDEYGENEGGFNENDKKPSFKWGEKAGQVKNKKDDDLNDEEAEEKLQPMPKAATLETTSKPSNTSDIKTDTPNNNSSGSYIPPAFRRQQAESSEKPSSTTSSSNTSSDTSANKYVPPSMRNKTTTDSAIPTTSVNYRRPNKSQPNIMDTMEFPTLDSADNGPTEKVSNENSNERFELPKKSGKVDQKSSKNMIDLGNAFSALSS